jgi:flagella basal body P-ring formation protein FlgA
MLKPHLSPLPDLHAHAPVGSARDVRALLRAPLLLLALFCMPVLAAAGAEPSEPAPRELERWLKQSVQLPNGQRLRVEVEIGTLNKGLKLAPCDRAEPFLPGNTRLWGRANVGLRCVLGARWTTYVPVKISAWGPALVARVALPAGRVPRPEDFAVEEVDWAASYSAPITSRSVLQGRELTRPVSAGQPILVEYLRIAPAVRAGEPVAVRIEGRGFTIGTEAVALSSAADGQAVRVRTAAGKVLYGMVAGTTVRIVR